MNRPNITPGPWELNAGRALSTSSGTFHLSYGHEKATSMPLFRSPTELDRNAQAIAALPDLLKVLEGLLLDKYLADPINVDRMAPAKAALIKAGYTF